MQGVQDAPPRSVPKLRIVLDNREEQADPLLRKLGDDDLGGFIGELDCLGFSGLFLDFRFGAGSARLPRMPG
jgi:hypothetical protein